MVKDPSFGGESYKYTPDMPGSNPAAKKSPPGRVSAKSRPFVTVAGVSQIQNKGQSVVNRSYERMRRIRHGFESYFQTSP